MNFVEAKPSYDPRQSFGCHLLAPPEKKYRSVNLSSYCESTPMEADDGAVMN